jgi:hypothetical protein
MGKKNRSKCEEKEKCRVKKVLEMKIYSSSQGGFFVDLIVLLTNGKIKRIIGFIKKCRGGYKEEIIVEYYLKIFE